MQLHETNTFGERTQCSSKHGTMFLSSALTKMTYICTAIAAHSRIWDLIIHSFIQVSLINYTKDNNSIRLTETAKTFKTCSCVLHTHLGKFLQRSLGDDEKSTTLCSDVTRSSATSWPSTMLLHGDRQICRDCW